MVSLSSAVKFMNIPPPWLCLLHIRPLRCIPTHLFEWAERRGVKLLLLELHLVGGHSRRCVMLILNLIVVVARHEGLVGCEIGLVLVVGFGKGGSLNGFE